MLLFVDKNGQLASAGRLRNLKASRCSGIDPGQSSQRDCWRIARRQGQLFGNQSHIFRRALELNVRTGDGPNALSCATSGKQDCRC